MRKRKYANLVSMPIRFVNHILDMIIFNVIILVILVGIGLVLASRGQDQWFYSAVDKLNGVAGSFYTVLLYLVYYSVFETLYGKSLAKFITKTRVVDRQGKTPGWLDVCGRSLCRMIPFDALSFLFGQNWHDRFSNTSVVYDD